MGFFSWKTADSKESIPSDMASHRRSGKKVYLLQPHGEKPILSDGYEGYGVFGGQCVFDWLSMINTGVTDNKLGIMISCDSGGIEYKGKVYVCDMSINRVVRDVINKTRLGNGDVPIEFVAADNYGTEFELNLRENNTDGVSKMMTLNTMNQMKLGRNMPFSEMITCRYPLKFSYNEAAVYEDLPASEECEKQGFFY